MNYHCFISLFSEVAETKIEKSWETRELIKHCIQLSHNSGYQSAKTLVERTYGNHHKMLSSSAADLGFNFRGCAKWNLRFEGHSEPPKGVLGAATEANAFRAICSLKLA